MRVLVFDADDTLWMTEWQYSGATADFLSFLYRELPGLVPNLNYVRDRYFEIDSELFKTRGVGRGRVAESMLLIYREICEWTRWRFDENPWRAEHEAAIREIGDRPFDYTKLRWLPGVEETLSVLTARGDRLCLLTSYDTDVFPGRAGFMAIDRFFAPVHVRAINFRKTTDDFRLVSGWNEDGAANSDWKWYAVGNGESDIRPALEISEQWRGVYIPYGATSAYFPKASGPQRFMPPPFEHPRVVTIRSMKELLAVIA